MGNATAQKLVAHWNWASSNNLINPSTGTALAVACRKVLEVQDGWESLDIGTLDIEEKINNFKDVKSRSLKPISLKDYEGKFRRAVASYRQYLAEPSTWRYPSRQGSWYTTGGRMPSASEQPRECLHSVRTPVSSETSVDYEYPFRTDFLATLTIPRDATTTEIERLVAWARTLAVDYQPKP